METWRNNQGELFPPPVYLAARMVIADLTDRTLLEGGRLNDLKVLLALAGQVGCHWEWRDGGGSEYSPESTYGRGAIMLDKTEPLLVAIRALAHELTHHLLYWEMVWLPSDTEAALGDIADAEERICRCVEDLVVALPDGFQWDGRLAVPRGNGRVRVYTVKPIPSFMNMPAQDIAAIEDAEF